MKLNKIPPPYLFGASQVLGAPFAVYFQNVAMKGMQGTEGVTISVFCCLFFFDLFNAVLSSIIWKPTWENWYKSDISLIQKDARAGCILYMVSAAAYCILSATCGYERMFVEHLDILDVFKERDWMTFKVVIGIVLALYVLAKMRTKEPFFNPYFCGIIGFVIVVVPQFVSGINILSAGTKGVAGASLVIGLGLIICKLAYYRHIHKHDKEEFRRRNAIGVLIAETGNITSWLFVIYCFYTTSH